MAYTPEGGIFSGNVLLDVYDSVTGNLTGERDVGNTRNLTFDPPSFEKKEKIGKRIENFGQTIESVITKQTQSLKFTLDDINRENLILAMFGEGSSISVSAGSVTDEVITARHDKYVKLTKRKLKSDPAPVVTNEAGTTTYTESTDYEIDYNAGMLKALSTGTITDGQSLKIDYSYNAYSGYKVSANEVTSIYAQLRLIGKNTINNDDVEVLVHRVSLMPSGGVEWITDDYATLEFTGDILATDNGTWEVTVLAA